MINLISGSDIESKKVIESILNELKKYNNFIFITATLNIKEIREAQFEGFFKSYSPNNDIDTLSNLFTFTEFQKWISHKVYRGQEYISTADQKYILSRIIELDTNIGKETKRALLSMKHELFDLYKFLLFYDKKFIPDNVLNEIANDFSITEKEIFYLFNLFSKNLSNVVLGIREGNLDSLNIDKSIFNLFKTNESKTSIDLYLNKVKELIDNTLQQVEAVFMDGFLFFDDIQKYVITSAITLGKRVNLVAKYSISDQTNSFLFEDNYLKLSNELGHEVDYPVVDDSEFNDDTALDFVKMKYPNIDMRISGEVKAKIKDNSINIIKPFPNRDKELQFIVNKVSELIKEECSEEEREIRDFVNNDIAIVLAVEKEKYEDRLNTLFKDMGVFIYKGDHHLAGSMFSEVNPVTIQKVCYNKKEFLNTEVHYKDGAKLTFDEKYKLFNLIYSGIGINKTPRPISSYPIGQFIFQVYNIITKGMSIDGFKMILYSNWHYNINKSPIKWDQFISQFKNIQAYFEGLHSVDEWIKEAEKILLFKYEVENESLYKWHPFNHIDIEFLLFLTRILNELLIISKSIKDIEGSIQEHIEELKLKVLDADTILSIDQGDLNFEQKLIKKFNNAIDEIGNNSIVNGLDTNYFSENLKGMLTDWENERLIDDFGHEIRISVVNLENMHKFKYSFFMMLESDKYPRKHKYEFPFTQELLQIIDDEKYGINKHPAHIHGIDYHLKLEQYLFKNVLDFTKNRLYITYTEKEDKNTNKPSIYIEDITSMFDVDIKDVFLQTDIKSNNNFIFDTNQNKDIMLPKKNEYSFIELGMFMLCPRLYFHLNYKGQDAHIAYISRFQLRFYCEAVLYCLLFEKFKEYNEINEAVYSAHNDEYYFILKSLLEDIYSQVIRYFDFLMEYEKKDIKNKVLNKAVNFITENAIVFAKFNEFKVENCKFYPPGGRYEYNFVFNNDILISDYPSGNPRNYQNRKYIDFLMQATGEEINTTNVRDLATIIECLDSNRPNIDRINLVTSLIHQLNIHFTSNNLTAIKIAKNIVATDFSKAEMKKSGFCNYCMINEICKGSQHMSKENTDEL